MPVPVYKVLLVGNANVGKSSLIRRLLLDEFDPSYRATVGVDLSAAALNIDPFTPVILTLIDLGGQADFAELRSQYYRGAHFALFVYDVCDRTSFDDIEQWYRGVEENIIMAEDRPLFARLLANKVDCEEHREVSKEDGQFLAERLAIGYDEVSAKTGFNVPETFSDIAKILYDAFPPLTIKPGPRD